MREENIMDTEKKSKRRLLRGKIVSTKMSKTVVVEVERRVLHSKYKKFMKKAAKYHAHDEDETYQLNENVIIQESRPLSKKKRWVVVGRV